MWDPFAEFERIVLPNGLTIHKAYWPGRPWEHIGCIVHAGARDDRVGREGTAHFVEHVVSENMGMNPKEFRQELEVLGGRAVLGATSSRYTNYGCYTPIESEPMQNVLTFMSGLLLHCQINERVEEERQIIEGEWRRRFKSPLSIEMLKMEGAALFPSAWDGRIISPLGSLESIALISKEDLQEFYDRYYAPKNLTLVCVGGMETESLVKMLGEQGFGVMRDGERNGPPPNYTNPPPPIEKRIQISMSEKLKTQAFSRTSRCGLKWVLPGGQKRYLIGLFGSILGEIVFEEIREKRQLSYAPKCGRAGKGTHSYFHLDSGDIQPGQEEEVLAALQDCIALMPNQRESFERKKQRAIASLRMRDLNGDQVVSGAMSDIRSYGEIVSFAQMEAQYLELTFEDALDLLAWFSDDRCLEMIVTP